MFISNEEKINIKTELSLATSQISALITSVATLQKRVIDLENTTIKMAAKVKKPKKPLTPEQKAKQRDYQRMYKARKKQEEKDWKLVEAIAAEGNTNVSA